MAKEAQKIIYSMMRIGKSHQKKTILKDISLS